MLCEGDPLFYGSYMHLHVRLRAAFPTEVVPGVTAMSGCWSATGMPIVAGRRRASRCCRARMAEAELTRRLADTRRRRDHEGRPQSAEDPPRARRVAGKLRQAVYVERGTMANAASMRLADKPDDDAPYFALVLVPGWSNGHERRLRIGGLHSAAYGVPPFGAIAARWVFTHPNPPGVRG